MTAPTFRMVNYVFSLIRTGDDNFILYRIDLKEIALDLGIPLENLYRDMNSISKEMLRIVCSMPNEKGEIENFQWFSKATYHTGKGYCDVKVHDDMRRHLLKLNENFSIYEHRNTEVLVSVYQKKLFEFIISYKFIGHVYCSVDDMKYSLNTPKSFTANDIKRRIIEPVKQKAHKNLLDTHFDYEPRKKQGSKRIEGFEFKNIKAQKAIWSLQPTLGETKLIEDKQDKENDNRLSSDFNSVYKKLKKRDWKGTLKKLESSGKSIEELEFLVNEVDWKKKNDIKNTFDSGLYIGGMLKKESSLKENFEEWQVNPKKSKNTSYMNLKQWNQPKEEEKNQKKEIEKEKWASLSFDERLKSIFKKDSHIQNYYQSLSDDEKIACNGELISIFDKYSTPFLASQVVKENFRKYLKK